MMQRRPAYSRHPVDRAKCIDIGFWFSEKQPELPKPQDQVDAAWDPAERDRVIAYLNNGKVDNAYRGMSRCRICATFNGSEDLTDGTYVWPSGLAHYLEKHAVRLPSDFVAYVLSRPEPAKDKVAVIQNNLRAMARERGRTR